MKRDPLALVDAFFVHEVPVAAVLHECTDATATMRPIVIVGNGPAGVRVAQELARHEVARPLVLYGAETCEPYNRVRLSSVLAGELGWDSLTSSIALADIPHLERRYGCRVRRIDRAAQTVTDARGHVQPYDSLVLATGSRPHVPQIPGIELAGVFTFRDMADAQALLARRVRSRRTVVLGGGLLGLEAARSMRRFNTEVVVVEHAPRLMPRQLDEAAASLLEVHLENMGIRICVGRGVRRVCGEQRVSGIDLMDGEQIACDTVVVASGIRPNMELALEAGLPVDRGIRVDDQLRTADPAIYAVGECAEHRGIIYGLAAPGLEQATVAASILAGKPARYSGSMLATRLKVVGVPVLSIGRVTEDQTGSRARERVFRTGSGAYCKLVTERRRLVGAIAVGELPETSRLQEAVARHRLVWPWQSLRFAWSGRLWPEQDATDVTRWPDSAVVCNCTGVTRGQLGQAMSAGCSTTQRLAACTGASTVCGSCRPLLQQLAGAPVTREPVRYGTTLISAGTIAALIVLAVILPDAVPYASSVDVAYPWDALWRESFWKQTSGYVALSASVIALITSLRKRAPAFRLGTFTGWRVIHAVLGVLAIVALVAHTGGRLGSNLNLLLMSCFSGVVILGGLAGGAVALEHRFGPTAAWLRKRSTWLHLLLFWPVPVLLSAHVLKTYYF